MKKSSFKFRRYHPVNTNVLTDETILDYYYNQLLDYLFNEFKLKEPQPVLVSHLIGLVATDYVKQLVEKNEKPSAEETAEFLRVTSLPANWKFPWWKKRVVKNHFIQAVQHCYETCEQDLKYIKVALIDGLWEVLYESRQEEFKVRNVPSCSE